MQACPLTLTPSYPRPHIAANGGRGSVDHDQKTERTEAGGQEEKQEKAKERQKHQKRGNFTILGRKQRPTDQRRRRKKKKNIIFLKKKKREVAEAEGIIKHFTDIVLSN